MNPYGNAGMGKMRMDPTGRFRLLAFMAAAIASVGLVALGVQIGTDGLRSNGPERNAASATAAPTAAVVDLRRARPIPGLDQALDSGLPVELAGGVGLPDAQAGAAQVMVPDEAPAPSSAPSNPSDAPAPVEQPPISDLPLAPVAEPLLPVASPILEPLEPVLNPLLAILDPLVSTGSTKNTTATTGLLPTLVGMLGL